MFKTGSLGDNASVAPTPLEMPVLKSAGIQASVLRLDRIHPIVSGNKWFKLKEHLAAAAARKATRLITFGGAWSNHIAATACAAKMHGWTSTGIIRGEPVATLSETLRIATGHDMDLEFLNRSAYAEKKDDPAYLDSLLKKFPGAYIIPEGGAGWPGIKGSEDILSLIDTTAYTHILCATGTGTTFIGLARAAAAHQQVIGIPVLHIADGLLDRWGSWIQDPKKLARCRLIPDYHFGGYARKTGALLDFMRDLYATNGLASDFVYTGKLFYAVLDLARRGFFPPASNLLIIHSGGLLGNHSLHPSERPF